MKTRTLIPLTFVPLFFAALSASALDLVNIKNFDPTIEVELRYATTRNVTGHALYPPNMPALIRPSVAQQLVIAQNYLQARGLRLKIWDAYRPKMAHDQLWQFLPNRDFVANPTDGGSLHTWGVAVDATLVYSNGHAVEMPTDFDEFTPATMLQYAGTNGNVRDHLHTLQRAMARAGFYGMRNEWWHFVSKDWKKFTSADTSEISAASPQPLTSSTRPPTADNPASHRTRATR